MSRPCYIRVTSLGGGVICARCGDDCHCVVCLPPEDQEDPPMITTEDGVDLNEGDRAFNYYDMKWGVIVPGTVDNEGWFRFRHDDGTAATLNGARLATYDPRER